MNKQTYKIPELSSGRVLKYTLLPGILPRISEFFKSGLTFISLCIVSIFTAVNILPYNHRFLRRDYIDRLSIATVLAEGARHVHWDRRHIDQILVYIMVVTGFVAIVFQFLILIFMLMSGPVAASGFNEDSIGDFFAPPVPLQDYALRVLDLVFGVPNAAGTGGFFGSCAGDSSAGTCQDPRGNTLSSYTGDFPTPVHIGLHSMLEFYNWMVVIVGFLILLYYVITLVAETAVHGTFWGQRANKTWIPLRLILFFALILPVPFYSTGSNDVLGFNTAQVITLNAAYYGSGLASNMWREFNTVTTEEYVGDAQNLIASPSSAPSIKGLAQYMSVVKTCAMAEETQNGRVIDAYIVNRDYSGANCIPLDSTPFDAPNGARQFSMQDDIRIRFGERAREFRSRAPYGAMIPCDGTAPSPAYMTSMADRYKQHMGYVIPYCGELTIPATTAELAAMDGSDQFGLRIQESYYTLIKDLWDDSVIEQIASTIHDQNTPIQGPVPALPSEGDLITMVGGFQESLENDLDDTIQDAITNDFFAVNSSLVDCGWFCAALWYNRIAEINGAITSSLFNIPQIENWPTVMVEVMRERGLVNENPQFEQMMELIVDNRQTVQFDSVADQNVAVMLNETFQFWTEYETLAPSDAGGSNFLPTAASSTGNPIRDMIVNLFGLSGLYDMRENAEIHPLAQLSMLGKGMIDATVMYFGGAFAFTIAGRLGGAADSSMESFTSILEGPVASFMVSFGLISLTIGFVLFYVLPFLPFIYFFFAAAGWIKAIFEAMVGLPLWALAHLRIDGEGLIPQTAASGYFLILDILLRPVLILFGLVASVNIFAAMVSVLNEMFDYVSANVGGYNNPDTFAEAEGAGAPTNNPDPFDYDTYRGPIDQFFYTVTYSIIVYMIGLSTFKLTDLVPNQIMRWLGEEVKTFGEIQGDPGQEFLSKIQGGVTLLGLKASGALGGISSRNNIKNNVEADEEQ